MGQADGDGTLITIESMATQTKRTTHTDGSGFFGLLGVAPGEYRLTAGPKSETVEICAGKVTVAP